jgi:hypothetical protein
MRTDRRIVWATWMSWLIFFLVILPAFAQDTAGNPPVLKNIAGNIDPIEGVGSGAVDFDNNDAIHMGDLHFNGLYPDVGISMGGAEEGGKEISDHPEKISCLYQGMATQDGQAEVNLIFINKTGKDINAFHGGFRVSDEDGETIQLCGFTYGKPFERKQKLPIPAFRYTPLREPSVKALTKHKDNPPMVFRLREIEYKNGKKETF